MGIVSFGLSGGMQILALRGDETVEIRLAENPTTGFRWEPVEIGASTVTSDTFSMAASVGVGASGERVFVIRTDPGTRILRFALRRAWEQVPPRAEAVVQIEAR